MPWKSFLIDGEYCVFKLHGDGNKIGSSLGCHDSREAANRQVAALNASETKENEMPDEIKEEAKELEEKAHACEYGIPFGVTSFVDLDAYTEAQETVVMMQDATIAFGRLAENIMMNEEIEDKAAALQSLANEFAARVASETKELDEKAVWTRKFINTLPDSSFLFIEKGGQKDEEGKTKPRSLRHFPYKDASGKVDLPHIRNAIARIPQSTAKGLNKAALQTKARKILEDTRKESNEASLIDKAISKFKEIMGIKEKPKSDGGFYVWKEADGYHWMSVYSNNIQDDDNPPDIISSKSHERFVDMVDKGLAPLPELWLWHVKEWKWGDATAVAYDDNGFAVAIGKVDNNPAAIAVADWLKEREDIKTSHGMPRSTVKREQDEKGNNIIVEHITREISPLFNFAAANKYTGFSIIKESDNMPIPKEKKKEFIEQGLAAPVLDELEKQNKVTDKETTDEGLEKKEGEQQEPAQETTEEVSEPVTRQEVAATLATVVKPLIDQVAALTEQVKELSKTDSAKIAEKAATTPAASLEAMTWDSIFGEKTKVDGRFTLSKSKPAEAAATGEDDWFIRDWIEGGKNA